MAIFNISDTVKVERKITLAEASSWRNAWVGSMNQWVGRTAQVVGLEHDRNGNITSVELNRQDIRSDFRFWFPPYVLSLVEEGDEYTILT